MKDEAIFAAGCFWGVEAAFQELNGVLKITVGYTGGHADNPSYQQVCSHNTGHAEAIRIEYDSEQISYDQLLTTFWQCHNPTTYHRQGPDVGSQYRSAIFYLNESQQQLAVASKAALEASGQYADPIVTEIIPAQAFWPAEDYHQHYYKKKGL